MYYLDFLEGLHAVLKPRTYLEIGVRNGSSLRLAQCPSIGIDPVFEIVHELTPDVHLECCTSDDYFSRLGDCRPFHELPVDLAFIDGLHLLEYAMRDIANVERNSDWSTVIAVDDIYPRNGHEAARVRHTQYWTGDVFKVLQILRAHRPDLFLVPVDTEPTGTLLIFCPDPDLAWRPTVLEQLASSFIAPDPQEVPEEILRRRGALEPEAVLEWSVWEALLTRRGKLAASNGRSLLRSLLPPISATS